MEQPKGPPLSEQVAAIRTEIEALAKELKIKREEALALLTHRELVIFNQQLTRLNEILGKKKG